MWLYRQVRNWLADVFLWDSEDVRRDRMIRRHEINYNRTKQRNAID